MNIQSGTIISERYKIIEKIGVGGMAIVYRAKDEKLDRFVTFKVLKEEFISDEDFIKRFNVEARAAAKLNHHNIVSVYDVGNDGNVYYIVMEYIDGFTLKEFIKKKAPFENEETLGVGIQIASALEHAHKNNIIHRDIKPQNILVTKDGTIKVTDFGIARASTSTTVTVESMGSVHYFSPEQARGGFVDNKSDIYSLGIVLFEMATGNIPFNGDTAVALAMKHINEPLPDMLKINPNISKSLEQIILKATQKISSQRYQTVEDLNNDLKRALTNASGDFITKNIQDENSPTVRITAEEMAEIREMSKQSHDYSDDEYEDEYDDDDTDFFDDAPKKKKKKPVADNYDKKKERGVIVAAIVTSIALIALITSIGGYFINKKLNPEVQVPEFKGKTWDQAQKIATQFEIYIEKEEEYNDEVEKDMVVSQKVEAGTKVKKNDTIGVVVSLGSDKIIMPDVTDKEREVAYEMLKDKVKITDEYMFNDDVAIGVVIRQSPPSGAEISKNSNVTLYISKGKEVTQIIVPNVIDMSEASAKKSLQNSDLIVGSITTSESDTIEKGNVIRQGIKAGEQVDAGSVVSLVISSGKPEPKTTETTTEKETETTTENTTELIEETTAASSQTKTDTLHIDLSAMYTDEEEELDVVVIKKKDSATGEEIYRKKCKKSDFPLNVKVTGSEPTYFQVYLGNSLAGEETIEFN